jgi:hypothetical protein
MFLLHGIWIGGRALGEKSCVRPPPNLWAGSDATHPSSLHPHLALGDALGGSPLRKDKSAAAVRPNAKSAAPEQTTTHIKIKAPKPRPRKGKTGCKKERWFRRVSSRRVSSRLRRLVSRRLVSRRVSLVSSRLVSPASSAGPPSPSPSPSSPSPFQPEPLNTSGRYCSASPEAPPA